jgi:restriction endonuclease S subunit
MAKKKNNLTLEEKLQNSLVPKEEQPYQIPENWVWTYLLEGFAECKDKYRKPVNAKERESREGVVPYYGATGQVGWIDDYLTNEHLVLVGEDGAPFFELLKDKAYIIEGKAWINNHVHIVKSFYGMKGNEYLKHYLNIFNYNGYVNGTTRLKLTQSRLRVIPIPMAPILEQQRIVERIESLFSKLDEAKEKIQMSLDSFETRKSTILYQAFSGELTKKWREENGLRLDDWEETVLKDTLQNMTSKKPSGDYFYYIDIDSIDNHKQKVREPKKLETSKAPSRASRETLENDTLFSMVRPYLKNIAFIDRSLSGCIASTGFYVCRPNDKIYPEYLYLLLCSSDTVNYTMKFMKGDNSPSIRKSDLENMPVNLPSILEQKEIVCILDTIFEKEQDTQELIDLIEKIDLMKKSILARAFRGELGSNIPEEESAIGLLKSVLEV